MPFNIVITFNASIDIQQAIDWENEKASELGTRFLTYLYKRLATLSTHPLIGCIRYDNVRYTTTNVFQYLIYYTVDEQLQQVIILRVLHTKRNPIG